MTISKKRHPLHSRRILIGTMSWLMCVVGFFSAAQASPWVLKPGQLVVSSGYDQTFAQAEFLEGDKSKEVPYSLQGLLTTSTLSVGARLGVIDGFELELRVPLKVVNYTADPVILLPEPPPSCHDTTAEVCRLHLGATPCLIQ